MSNLSTLFARIFRIFGVNVTADATAALTGSTEAEKGELKTPFGVSKCIFPSDCKQLISFSPTTDSCAGWHNFLDHVSAHDMEQKMLGLIKGDGDGSDWDGDGEPDNVCLKDPCGQKWLDDHFDMAKEPDAEVTPGVTAGETQPPFEFQGGDVGSLFLGGVLDTDYHGGSEGTVIGDEKHPAPFPALFDYFRYRDGDNYTDADGVYHNNDNIWTATVPIYKDDACCTNPNGSTPIVEFAKIEITMPNPPPDKTVSVNFTCETSVIQGRGGGGNGNLKGTIPQLVE